MSGVCPTTPERNRNTYDDTPPARDSVNVPVPDAAFNVCDGGTNTDTIIAPRPDGETITVEKCCPSPGPVGPAGPQGDCGLGFDWKGEWLLGEQYVTQDPGFECNSSVVNHKGVAYIAILDHLADTDNEPGVGNNWATFWDALVGNTAVTWRGVWDGNSIDYYENDFVTHEERSYMATTNHTSDVNDPPDPTFDFGGGTNWILVSNTGTGNGLDPEEQGWFDNLFGGVFDWIKDIGNWGIKDWVIALAAGAGLIWAGTKLLDMFTETPEGDGQADSTYNGDPLFGGAYTPPTLPDACAALCQWAGVTSYDVSQLPLTEVNFTIGAITSARSTLEMLSLIYFFDMVDSDGILKFIPRGSQTSVRTLTAEVDLGFVKSGSAIPVPLSTKRLQGVDLPKELNLTYFSEANAHNEMVQTSTLETFTDGQIINTSVPVTLTEQQAYDIVEQTIVNAHVERTTYSFTTTYEHLDLEPGDVITVDLIGDVRIIRIEENEDEGILTFVCTDATFNVNNFTPSGIPAQPPVPYTDTPPVIGYSAGLIVELPPLDSTDNKQRLSLFPHGYGADQWPGCAIYYSIDGGSSYNLLTTVSDSSTWGKANSTLATPSSWYTWDETTTIDVELKTGTLSSVTKLDVLNGVNWALIGQEVIGFTNAVFQGGTTYTLSGLLRGRRGTEVYCGNHVADEGFILLDNTMVEFEYPIDAKEKIFDFKFVTIGSDITKATAYQAQPNVVSRRCWAPANVNASKSGNDWNITWLGRNQYEGEMVDSGPVPQPVDFGGFIIEILNIADDVVKRSTIQQTVDYLYTEADQIADFGSAQGTIKVRIAQIDIITGPGYNVTQQF